MTSRELREKREKLIKDAGDLRGANNAFENDEKRSQFDKIMTDIDAVTVELRDAERADKLETFARQQAAAVPETLRPEECGQRDEAKAKTRELRDRALAMYLAGQDLRDMPAEERAIIDGSRRNFSDAERRDMSTLSAANGGIVVAPDTRFYGQIIQAMKFFGGLEAAGAEVFNTDTAGPLPIPMGDDTGNVGTIVPEALASGHAGGTSPVLNVLTLNGYLYSSKVVKVSWQMLRDASIDVAAYVAGLLGERLARAQNAHFTATGTGVGMPFALSLKAAVGRQSVAGNTTSVPFDDIFRLVHSIDPAYRVPTKCKFMLADTNILTLRLAKDGVGRYLWPELGNVQTGQPLTLAGYPVQVNNDMVAMGASAKWASFGDHSFYKIRRINGLTISRINELYIEAGQVGFLAFQSADGGLADPATGSNNPVKLLQNSAS